MNRRFPLPIFLAVSAILPLASVSGQASLESQLQNLVRSAIEGMPLEAGDLVAATRMNYTASGGLVNLDLKLTPIGLKKSVGRIEFTGLSSIRAMASFEFIGQYDLAVCQRQIGADDITLAGEGAVYISFKGFKIKIDDIPSLVLMLADRAAECPDIGQIRRDPMRAHPGGSYSVATSVQSKHPGHLAYFLFANNRAAQNPERSLRTVLGTRAVDYETVLGVRTDLPPDNYFGDVMAVEVVSKSGNPLDFNSYEVLFSAGITMITVE